eukprot:Rhum_TRINITY_DN17141_c0_g1::Rhum_TRINITY_DN17141_c0_g1_i1::g.165291::m.165291
MDGSHPGERLRMTIQVDQQQAQRRTPDQPPSQKPTRASNPPPSKPLNPPKTSQARPPPQSQTKAAPAAPLAAAKPPTASPATGINCSTVQYLKGLQNDPHTYQCFVNVCLQGFLQLESLRQGVVEVGHACAKQREGDKVCVLCEVQYVVQSAPRTRAEFLRPDLVSRALHVASNLSIRPSTMSDATEVFFVITDELRNCTTNAAYWDDILPAAPLLLNVTAFVDDAAQYETCPKLLLPSHLNTACAASFAAPLPKPPAVLPFLCVWRRMEPNSPEFRRTLRVFTANINATPPAGSDESETIPLSALDARFVSTSQADHEDDDWDVPSREEMAEADGASAAPEPKSFAGEGDMELRGFVAYYPGKHYTAFFKLRKGKVIGGGETQVDAGRDVWAHFDDTRIRAISSKWSDVQEFLVAGNHMPVLLFYERHRAEGTPDASAATSPDLPDDWVEVADASPQLAPPPLPPRPAGGPEHDEHDGSSCSVM